MTNIVHVDFSQGSEECGYIVLNEEIEGVYCDELSICSTEDSNLCVIGSGTEQGIANPIYINKDNFNELCIMWLALHNPDALREN